MLQDMQNKSMQLKEGDQRASRVQARRAKYREIQDDRNGALKPTLIKEVGGSRLQDNGNCETRQNSLEPKLS